MDHCSCKDANMQALDKVLDACGHDAGNLITILQNAQEIYGYLPSEIIYYVAAQTGISPARVMGVATFYSQFRLEPVGKYLIMLCKGTACHVNGAETLEDVISTELEIVNGQTTKDGLFSLKTVACLGCCSLSPVMMINEEVYGLLTPDKVRGILNDLRSQAQQEGGSEA